MSDEATVDSIDQDNSWTERKEHQLLEWQQDCKIRAVGHGKTSDIHAKQNNRILIPTIFLGAIATVMDGAAILWPDRHIPIIATALLLTALATTLNGVLQSNKPAEKAQAHVEMAKGYGKIIVQITSIFAKERHERPNGLECINQFEHDLIVLKEGGVTIPNKIWNAVKTSAISGANIEPDPDKPFSCRKTIKRPSRPHEERADSHSSAHSGMELEDLDSLSPSPSSDIRIPVNSHPGQMPSSELRLGDSSKEYTNIQQTLYDFQIRRFG